MRVIAGMFGGRRLRAPLGSTTRPTSDRVREALFSILGPPPPGASVLDLFAGAGALGIEALSRGARRAVFVDSSRAALACLRRNLDDLGLAQVSEVHAGDVRRFAERLARRPPEGGGFHWIFLDPPYAANLADGTLEALGGAPALTRDGTVVLEHDRRLAPRQNYGSLVKAESRRYGDTELTFFHWPPDAR
jgi:16S rRNA (guanine966-N2)-methyltransferase